MGAAAWREIVVIAVGGALPELTLQVRADPMATMARLLRDPNPIHLDTDAVKAMGMGDKVVNQGPANLAYIMNMLAAAFPDWRIATINSAYLASVFDGDEVIAGGEVIRSEPDEIVCSAWLQIEGRGMAVKAEAVLMPR